MTPDHDAKARAMLDYIKRHTRAKYAREEDGPVKIDAEVFAACALCALGGGLLGWVARGVWP